MNNFDYKNAKQITVKHEFTLKSNDPDPHVGSYAEFNLVFPTVTSFASTLLTSCGV